MMFAFACEPGRGSEPGTGYIFVRALAQASKRHSWDSTVFTRPHTVEKIKAALESEELGDGVSIEAVSIPMWLVSVTRRERVRWAYLAWQMLAVKRARSTLRDDVPTVVHHVTFATDGLPTFERALRRHAARVFGPAGSTTSDRSWKARLARTARHYFARTNLAGAQLAIAQNDEVAASWQDFDVPVIVEPNIALPQDAPGRGEAKDTFRVAWSGVLVPRKDPLTAIRTVAELPAEYTLDLFGDGPLRSQIEQEIDRLGLHNRVSVHGWLDRNELLLRLNRCSILLHTSHQEGAPWAVGEAQTRGLIPVVRDGSGADVVVKLGGTGVVCSTPTPKGFAMAVQEAAAQASRPVDRWDMNRFSDLFAGWYSQAHLRWTGV